MNFANLQWVLAFKTLLEGRDKIDDGREGQTGEDYSLELCNKFSNFLCPFYTTYGHDVNL